MSWAIGYDDFWKRDIGYGVPAFCDHPDCNEKIDRGLAFVCGGEPYGGDDGCGLYFCEKHLNGLMQLCRRCSNGSKPFKAKPDHPEWVHHKLTDESWQEWRNKNPQEVISMKDSLGTIRIHYYYDTPPITPHRPIARESGSIQTPEPS